MDEVLTVEEINVRFDSEWILLDEPEVNEHQQVVRGKVVCHSKDRDEVYAKAIELQLRSSATLYTGTMPANSEVIL